MLLSNQLLDEIGVENMTTLRRVQASATTNTYVYCRIAARDALRQAEKKQAGCFYFRMMAGVFAAFTVEAFLNHLGSAKVPDWEARERGLGPREKLRLLCTVRGWLVDQSKRPYQTFRVMLTLRDSLAHGRTETVETNKVLKRPLREADSWPEPEWKRLCALPSVKRMVEDAEAIVRDLHSRTGSLRDPFASLEHAWSGIDDV
jgi:hypothetical protein